MALAATALTAAAPPMRSAGASAAVGGYRHYNRGGAMPLPVRCWRVLGLGIGAAIASSNRPRYYDRGYYYDAPPPPPRVVYEDRYYAPPSRPPRVVVRERYYNYNYPSYGYGYGY